ncbi:histidine phosphatase family protein [Paenibacillus humicola]|uniref:histidine phosphatase family protein n=1 Tax=Paenibacillus humicola TaxID=3110540 RepID=UPI00237A69D9|nr:histidine phosphatase family protein [Paenibacillus humicola]
MKTNVYMVRHADSPFVFGEERTRGLSQEGFAAAKRAAEFFTDVEIHYIASSPYARAKQTVQTIAEQKALPIDEFEALAERAIKGLDYKAPWEELLAAIRRSFEDKDFALAGGESTRQAQERAVPVLEKLLQERRGQNIVIGTHGNIMTIMMNHYDDSYGYAFWDATTKADIYKLVFDGNRLEQVERIWS